MGLRFDPIGGGQFKAALKQIIDAEREPIKQIEARKAREEQKMKLFQEFKGKFTGADKVFSELSNFRRFRELKVDLGDGANQVSVTLDKEKANPGSYKMEIDELAARSSIISNGFSSPDEPNLGIGYVVVYLPNGDSADLFIDEDHASLHGIESMINKQQNSPVRASVIKDLSDSENPWRLVITGKKDGEDDALMFPQFYFLDGREDFYVSEENDAKNALLKLDDFEIEGESNDIPEFLTGVNMHLKQAKPDQPFTMNITEDYQKIAGKVKAMVDQVNSIFEFIIKQNQVDEKSDTRTMFTGDTSLQGMEFKLRNLFHEAFPTYSDPDDEDTYHPVFLHELGIEFAKTGLLTFKEEKFTKAIEGKFEQMAEAICGENGIAIRLRQAISGYTQTGDGFLNNREQALRNKIKAFDDQIAIKERRIDQKQEALTAKFARLQGTLSDMQRQQQYLSATLPSGGSNNLVSQLLGG